jgi:hypothetical protein
MLPTEKKAAVTCHFIGYKTIAGYPCFAVEGCDATAAEQ